jgi:Rad3-related DNA helicase
VVTNYSYWLFASSYGEGIGAFDMLVLDEAHDAPEELSRFLAIWFGPREIQEIGIPPSKGWRGWASRALETTRRNYRETVRQAQAKWTRTLATKLKHYKSMGERLRKVTGASDENWILISNADGYTWHPIIPADHAETLFQRIPKVVLFSATLRRKTMRLLGIPEENSELIEYPSSFPVARRRVTWVPTVDVGRDTSLSNLRVWAERIDEILAARLDRKGIIHTVSYARADQLLRMSRSGRRFISHGPRGAREAVKKFKEAGSGAVLVSPSVGTGWDFPGQECEYQIIAKLPFPDRSSEILKARAKRDKSYEGYLTMQEVVQMAGRGMRSEDDQCETFIVDNHWRWFWPANRKFAPGWFRESVRRLGEVPDPPVRLAG